MHLDSITWCAHGSGMFDEVRRPRRACVATIGGRHCDQGLESNHWTLSSNDYDSASKDYYKVDTCHPFRLPGRWSHDETSLLADHDMKS
jgi:hypothetical protein